MIFNIIFVSLVRSLFMLIDQKANADRTENLWTKILVYTSNVTRLDILRLLI